MPPGLLLNIFMQMNPKFKQLEEQFHQIQDRLADPSLPQGTAESQRFAREFKRLEPVAQKVRALAKVLADLEGLQSLQSDPEMRDMAADELKSLAAQRDRLNAELEDFLIPRDPQDDRDVIMEIRAGAGGDEAAIFAGDLFRMYTRYAAERGFGVEPYSTSSSERGGFKEAVFGIKGQGAYRRFKYES